MTLMSRLLGRLEWALRPNAGAAAFLATAYHWLMGDHVYCGLSLLRSLMTAIIYALLPQQLKPDNCPALPREGVADKHFLFCDAAPPTDGRRFFMGVYLPGGDFRHWRCPKWVKTLQQAKLLAIVRSFQIAGFMGWSRAYLGCDSFVARAQATSLRASTALSTQQRILRRFFWFRSWTRLRMSVFGVSTEQNPVDPPSRAFDFRHIHEVRTSADRRFRAWQFAQEPFFASTQVPPFPW